MAAQNHAQELYVTNGDGSIGVAYTYRNFTGTSLYYGISMTGRFLEAQLFEVRSWFPLLPFSPVFVASPVSTPGVPARFQLPKSIKVSISECLQPRPHASFHACCSVYTTGPFPPRLTSQWEHRMKRGRLSAPTSSSARLVQALPHRALPPPNAGRCTLALPNHLL